MTDEVGMDDLVRKRFFLKCCEPGAYLVYDPIFDIFEFESYVFSNDATLGYAHGRLLELLVACVGEVVSREHIFSVAWPDRVVTASSLNQAISTLRQLFGDTDGRVIKTIPRRGYLFNPDYLLCGHDPMIKNLELSMAALNKEPVELHPLTGDTECDLLRCSVLAGDNSCVTPTIHAAPAPPKKSVWQRFEFHNFLVALIVLFAALLLYRLYYIWEEKSWFESKLVVTDEQSVLFVASNALEVEEIQLSSEELRRRFMNSAHGSSYLVFNKMHSYLDIVCVSSKGHPKFILVHEKSVSLISDEQINECLK